MDEQLPAEVDEDADYPKQAKQMFAKLAMVVNQYTGDRSRFRGLVLLQERENGKATPRPITKLLAYDIPQAELILHHAMKIRRLEHTIAGMHEFLTAKIREKSIEGLLSCMEELTKWENTCLKQEQMLDTLIDKWANQIADKEGMMAKLANDYAYLEQKVSEHRDKMELANKAASMPSDTEMKQRLAHKYGITVQEVEAMMSAKLVEHEQG